MDILAFFARIGKNADSLLTVGDLAAFFDQVNSAMTADAPAAPVAPVVAPVDSPPVVTTDTTAPAPVAETAPAADTQAEPADAPWWSVLIASDGTVRCNGPVNLAVLSEAVSALEAHGARPLLSLV